MTQAVERLVQHVMQTRFDDLSPEAVAAAKRFCLDTLGVCIAGTSAPYAAEVRTVAASWGSGAEATALGVGDPLPATTAALVNAYHTHNQEYDCVHELAVVHPLTTIQSAVLAYAERCGGLPGRDVILALVLGVDVATSIGMAAHSGLTFFRPAAAGIFGVAAAVGKLASLDREGLLDAFGLAYAQSGGSMQAHEEGKPTLALQMALAAASGLRAVDLAQAGFPGPHDVLEGRFGYFRLYEGAWDIGPVWAELGTIWRITQMSHKPFPTGRATHGGIDGILQLRAQHAIQAEDVDRLILQAPPLIQQLVGRPMQPQMQANYARLCFQYAGALALVYGAVDVPDFRPERLTDPHLQAIGRRIEVEIDDNPDPNALAPQRVIARLKNGGAYTVDVLNTLGSPQRPLTQEQSLDKFRRCLSYGIRPLAADTPARIIDMIDRLDELDNTNDIIKALCPVEG
jgi:2-methylcitrate dehydratase PrpD